MRKEEGGWGSNTDMGYQKKCHYHCYHLNPKIVKDLVVELAHSHTQSAWDLRGKGFKQWDQYYIVTILNNNKKKIFYYYQLKGLDIQTNTAIDHKPCVSFHQF